MEIEPSTPRVAHIFRYSPGAKGIKLVPELAEARMFQSEADKGRMDLGAIMTRTNAVAGINADYFDWSADPLGAMVRDGNIISRPYGNRSVFAWNDSKAMIGRLTWKCTITNSDDEKIEVTGLNEPCPKNGLCLVTDASAFAFAEKPCEYLVLSLENATWPATSTRIATAQEITRDEPKFEVKPGTAILAARDDATLQLEKIRPGAKIRIQMQTDGIDLTKFTNVLGGGPMLVENGVVNVDAAAEQFKEGLEKNRHPRSAVGITATGEWVFVALDGRQELSAGMTLAELADYMIKQGCVSAMNLDGGGSTTARIFGLTVNRPSDGVERKIADAFVWVRTSEPPTPSPLQYRLSLPAECVEGTQVKCQVIDSSNKPVQSGRIFWASLGDGWVDQGGNYHATHAGAAEIRTWVGGQLLTAKLTVKAK